MNFNLWVIQNQPAFLPPPFWQSPLYFYPFQVSTLQPDESIAPTAAKESERVKELRIEQVREFVKE